MLARMDVQNGLECKATRPISQLFQFLWYRAVAQRWELATLDGNARYTDNRGTKWRIFVDANLRLHSPLILAGRLESMWQRRGLGCRNNNERLDDRDSNISALTRPQQPQ